LRSGHGSAGKGDQGGNSGDNERSFAKTIPHGRYQLLEIVGKARGRTVSDRVVYTKGNDQEIDGLRRKGREQMTERFSHSGS
jgi:hypothetical protein